MGTNVAQQQMGDFKSESPERRFCRELKLATVPRGAEPIVQELRAAETRPDTDPQRSTAIWEDQVCSMFPELKRIQASIYEIDRTRLTGVDARGKVLDHAVDVLKSVKHDQAAALLFKEFGRSPEVLKAVNLFLAASRMGNEKLARSSNETLLNLQRSQPIEVQREMVLASYGCRLSNELQGRSPE